MEDEVIYLLYEVQYLDESLQFIERNEIKNAFKQILSSEYSLNVLNLIYPTFDQKLFITINKSERNRLDKEIRIGDQYHLKKVTEEFQIIYFELKNAGFGDNDANISLNQKYAVKMMKMKDATTSDTLNLYRGDTYQYQLIQDFLGNKVFRKRGSDDEVFNETKTRSKIIEEEIKNNDLDIIIVNDDTDKFRYRYDKIDLGVEIYKGDLVEAQADAIVNAANRNLSLGGGVAESIRKRGGNKVQTECDDYLRKKNLKSLQDGEVMNTKSYDMKNIDFIIHAVGPDIYNYKHDKNKCYAVLKSTFYNVFEYANSKLKIKSIALPLISSGIFGVPKDECCKQLYKALNEFIQNTNPNTRNLKYIRIPSIDTLTNNELMNNFKAYLVDDNLMKKIETKKIDYKKQLSLDNTKLHEPITKPVSKDIVKNEDEQHDTCVICGEKKKITKSLENCKCKYCKDCEENYNQNGEKCNC
jgi:O-acetyl-ADP-ribose deacetylase (regulator of RNase III)